jgi:hypothetical protein
VQAEHRWASRHIEARDGGRVGWHRCGTEVRQDRHDNVQADCGQDLDGPREGTRESLRTSGAFGLKVNPEWACRTALGGLWLVRRQTSDSAAAQVRFMKTLDLKRDLKYLYSTRAKAVELVTVPRLQFVMIDGAIEKGSEPGVSPAFAEAVQALYGVSYTLKFMLKKRADDPVDYPVMALEGLWWVSDGKWDINIKDNLLFTLMIMQPDVVTPSDFDNALAELRRKRGSSLALEKLRLETFEEGLCIQVMHVGPYATEPASVERMEAFASEHGYVDCVGLGGKHHEIYLGDPRRADPARLKTILRHPVRAA